MHSTTLYLTEKQKAFFEDRRVKTGIPMAVQIREAIDLYIQEKEEKEK